MSWNKRISFIATASLAAVLSVPVPAHAQRGGHGSGGGHTGGGNGPRGTATRVVTRPVVVSPYFARYYSPFYSPFYDPFYFGFSGWGYPGFYMPMFYGPGAVLESSARLQVTPKQTEVYVDGYKAGIVDDFDGMSQRLRVAPGEHVIELYLDGHRSIAEPVMFASGQTYRIRHTMEALVDGEPAPSRPTPKPGVPSPAPRGPFDAFGRAITGSTESAASPAGSGATLMIRVQPDDASILVDGERWQSSGGERLEIQVSAGEHRVEVQKDGYQPFTTSVRVKAGDTAPVNVSLSKSGGE